MHRIWAKKSKLIGQVFLILVFSSVCYICSLGQEMRWQCRRSNRVQKMWTHSTLVLKQSWFYWNHLPPRPNPLFLALSSQINYVTFPSLACMTEQQLLKPNEWSYCDFFWVNSPTPLSSYSFHSAALALFYFILESLHNSAEIAMLASWDYTPVTSKPAPSQSRCIPSIKCVCCDLCLRLKVH